VEGVPPCPAVARMATMVVTAHEEQAPVVSRFSNWTVGNGITTVNPYPYVGVSI
jgi:hypothetical protein